jgi:hypothetical protein
VRPERRGRPENTQAGEHKDKNQGDKPPGTTKGPTVIILLAITAASTKLPE